MDVEWTVDDPRCLVFLMATKWVEDYQKARNVCPESSMDVQDKAALIAACSAPFIEMLNGGYSFSSTEDDGDDHE